MTPREKAEKLLKESDDLVLIDFKGGVVDGKKSYHAKTLAKMGALSHAKIMMMYHGDDSYWNQVIEEIENITR